jgi:DNA-binding CsgD family transcriptional regulator
MPRTETDLFLGAVERIYEAACDPKCWQDAIDHLCRAYPGGQGTLLRHDVSDGKGLFAWTSGWDSTWVEAYNSHYNLKNPWLPNLRKRPAGKAVPAEFMLERSELLKTEFFSDFLNPQGLLSGIGVTIAQDKSRFVAVSVLYPEITDRESERHVRHLQRLTPHLVRAFEVNQRLEMAAIRARSAEQSLSKLRIGVVLASGDSKVLFANEAAEAILKKADGLRTDRGGQLGTTMPDTTARLRQVIQSTALTPGAKAPGGSIAVQRPSGGGAYSVLVAPVSRSVSDLPQASAIILISQNDFATSPEILSEALGITRAEAKVLGQLLTGCTIPDCGARMDISPHTARTHLRNIFDKLGVSSKAQLMKRVADHPIWLVNGR